MGFTGFTLLMFIASLTGFLVFGFLYWLLADVIDNVVCNLIGFLFGLFAFICCVGLVLSIILMVIVGWIFIIKTIWSAV